MRTVRAGEHPPRSLAEAGASPDPSNSLIRQPIRPASQTCTAWSGVCDRRADVPTTTYTPPNPTVWTAIDWPVAVSWARAKYVALAGAVVLALAFRITALSTYGLSEDEINKLQAVEQYRAGRFIANAEHPMLMKLAMWGSVAGSDAWNARVPAALAIPLETALRAPNAVAGAATTAAIFGVADLLFGGSTAVVAAAIWAFDVNAIAINRIGKEDTFLLLFFLLAIYAYERAKRTGARDLAVAQRWYTLSGAAFGLMLASKYMPHYLGIYAIFNLITDPEPGANRPGPLRHYGAMAIAFLLANPAILSAATWRYAAHYVGGELLAHHGYLYAGALYVTNVPVSPLGVPPTYYLRLLGTRVPLVVLAAAVPGAIELIRRRAERGFVLLRTLAIFLLVPYSLMAAKFLRYSLPMIATLDLIAAVGLVAGIGWLLRKGWLTVATRRTVAALASVVFAVGVASAPQAAAPFYSLFQNGVGARIDPRGSAFPEQTYDYGVREAAALIASAAGPSAVVVTDAPAVASQYLQRDGRPDIAVRGLSSHGIAAGPAEAWVLVQDEHVTFENRLLVERLRATRQPWTEIRMGDLVALQVFRLPETTRCHASSS
jgi:Dolichyl-phosphate-mannose-protein mannosyltransferase